MSTAFAVFTCENDSSHTETVNAEITSETTAATCEKDGKTVYTATVTFGDKTYTDTKAETISKLGHSYGQPEWTWNGYDKATAAFTCANDSSHVETVNAEITSETTAAACEKDGKTVYTATATFGGKTYTNTKTIPLSKTGHDYEAVWDWPQNSDKTIKTDQVTVTLTCKNDTSHTVTLKASVMENISEDESSIDYTASISYEGVTYTDSVSVTPVKPIMYGDVDGDEALTSNDSLIILRASLGLTVLDSEQKQKAADFDKDGVITSNDALEVLRESTMQNT